MCLPFAPFTFSLYPLPSTFHPLFAKTPAVKRRYGASFEHVWIPGVSTTNHGRTSIQE